MPLPLVPSTELDAVNALLHLIGEQPVDSLTTSGDPQVDLAQNFLHSVSRTIQARGMHCNTEENVKLSPDAQGHITIPTDTLKIDATDKGKDLVMRGSLLYDRYNHTYIFKEPVEVDLVTFLPFESLPQVVRDYITIKAARMFQVRTLGSDLLIALTEQDEREAWLALVDEEFFEGDYNFFSGDMAEMLRR